MLSNAYFLAKFRFDTAENEPAKKLLIFSGGTAQLHASKVDAALLGPGENDATGLDNSLRATVASRKLQVSSSSSVHSKPKSLRDILGELVAGVILFFMSIGILWVNEGHAVKIQEANEFTSILISSLKMNNFCNF